MCPCVFAREAEPDEPTGKKKGDGARICYEVKVCATIHAVPSSHSLPMNAARQCAANLFDPYHAQKQMSWNATDTACEWEMTGRA